MNLFVLHLPLFAIWFIHTIVTINGQVCERFGDRNSRKLSTPDAECDLSERNWCSVKGSKYPAEMILDVLLDNRGIMKRLFDDRKEARFLEEGLNFNHDPVPPLNLKKILKSEYFQNLREKRKQKWDDENMVGNVDKLDERYRQKFVNIEDEIEATETTEENNQNEKRHIGRLGRINHGFRDYYSDASFSDPIVNWKFSPDIKPSLREEIESYAKISDHIDSKSRDQNQSENDSNYLQPAFSTFNKQKNKQDFFDESIDTGNSNNEKGNSHNHVNKVNNVNKAIKKNNNKANKDDENYSNKLKNDFMKKNDNLKIKNNDLYVKNNIKTENNKFSKKNNDGIDNNYKKNFEKFSESSDNNIRGHVIDNDVINFKDKSTEASLGVPKTTLNPLKTASVPLKAPSDSLKGPSDSNAALDLLNVEARIENEELISKIMEISKELTDSAENRDRINKPGEGVSESDQETTTLTPSSSLNINNKNNSNNKKLENNNNNNNEKREINNNDNNGKLKNSINNNNGKFKNSNKNLKEKSEESDSYNFHRVRSDLVTEGTKEKVGYPPKKVGYPPIKVGYLPEEVENPPKKKKKEPKPLPEEEPFPACNSTLDVITPTWAKNSEGEMLIVVNVGAFTQHVHIEECGKRILHRQAHCKRGCRCQQNYRLQNLLVMDPNDKCKGIFSDWFRFPSACVCVCFKSQMRSKRKKNRNGQKNRNGRIMQPDHELPSEDDYMDDFNDPEVRFYYGLDLHETPDIEDLLEMAWDSDISENYLDSDHLREPRNSDQLGTFPEDDFPDDFYGRTAPYNFDELNDEDHYEDFENSVPENFDNFEETLYVDQKYLPKSHLTSDSKITFENQEENEDEIERIHNKHQNFHEKIKDQQKIEKSPYLKINGVYGVTEDLIKEYTRESIKLREKLLNSDKNHYSNYYRNNNNGTNGENYTSDYKNSTFFTNSRGSRLNSKYSSQHLNRRGKNIPYLVTASRAKKSRMLKGFEQVQGRSNSRRLPLKFSSSSPFHELSHSLLSNLSHFYYDYDNPLTNISSYASNNSYSLNSSSNSSNFPNSSNTISNVSSSNISNSSIKKSSKTPYNYIKTPLSIWPSIALFHHFNSHYNSIIPDSHYKSIIPDSKSKRRT